MVLVIALKGKDRKHEENDFSEAALRLGLLSASWFVGGRLLISSHSREQGARKLSLTFSWKGVNPSMRAPSSSPNYFPVPPNTNTFRVRIST